MAWEKEHFETTKGTTTTKSDAISYNLEELNELIEKKKIVFIDINTKWCAPCKKMAPLFDEIDSIYTNDNTEIFKIDADQNPSITKELKIESVPVFILYHQGVEVWRKQGIISKEEISEKLESYAN
jgi:thioredoxin 1